MNEKTAVIWGASGGIGRALANTLIGRGWQVVAVGRDSSQLPDKAHLSIDISSIGDSFALQQAVMEAGIEIDRASLFIYAIGDIAAAPVAEMGIEQWQKLMEANLTGAYLAVHHALPLLTEEASIVFLGAIHERLRLPGLAAYAAAKAGLEAFAEALRKEQRKKQVLVIRPAAVDTPLWEKVPMKLPKGAMGAADLAEKILAAIDGGETGIVDFSH